MGRILGLNRMSRPRCAAARSFAAGGGGWADHGRMLGARRGQARPARAGRARRAARRRVHRHRRRDRRPGGHDRLGNARHRLCQGGRAAAGALGKPICRLHGRARTADRRRSTAGCRRRCSAPRWSMRSATSAPIRPATWARSASPARPNRRSRPRSAATAPSTATSSSSCAARPQRFRRSCAPPPTMSGGFIASCRAPVSAAYVEAARRARRHFARLEARRGHPRRRAEGRRGGDRGDLQDDGRRDPRRGRDHAQSSRLHQRASTSAR